MYNHLTSIKINNALILTIWFDSIFYRTFLVLYELNIYLLVMKTIKVRSPVRLEA